MNSLQVKVFKNNEFQINAMLIDDEPHFVGSEVAKMLGYSNPQKAIRDHTV